mmetsp:Transcript_49658/g.120395  ORF Transcript_49658/g.120395 Transcript_49658/m.120395 type:complete len:494 (-) Transcript_49658:164-1645(-)|eukprot:CAMPEP_0113501482 /NCGR_PEP_ID=MMETSP0014_2-20120614/32980_1 /TAXON_ID=2857 /ORGANISM="Nitzschia sp." /LENGTH=493 /DNA_ID=CAMNT_0000396077 /DNA_START=228 /DNA_END=1709 /DNA_ORIENTATION=+ /assembly_acc=CAM_ASM_000159
MMSRRILLLPPVLFWGCTNFIILCCCCCINSAVPVWSKRVRSGDDESERLLPWYVEKDEDRRDREELKEFWGRIMVDDLLSMSMTADGGGMVSDGGGGGSSDDDGDCSSSSSSPPLSILFVGNSFTGGSGVGRACLDDDSDRPDCEEKAVPGQVRTYVTDPSSGYPGEFDHPPAETMLVDPTSPYHAFDNPNKADVPSKINAIANHFCRPITYDQNTQSAFTTRSHAGQAGANPQSGTIRLLNETSSTYDLVFIQPQSTEYLSGARSSRVDALQLLATLATRQKQTSSGKTSSSSVVVQQTWPRRESTTYNQICDTTEDVTNEDGTRQEEVVRQGMMERIDGTLSDLADQVTVPFTVAPTGDAFVEFARLACGDEILPDGACAFDTDVDCPIWFGDGTRTSLFAENRTVEGFHQSGDVGAWLSATVLYGVIQSSVNNGVACYVSEKDLDVVFPAPPPDLVDIPSGNSIPYLISEASRSALASRFKTVTECQSA